VTFLGKEGDRVRLVAMPDDPDPIPQGTEGTVIDTTPLDWGSRKQTQVSVKWDNGRSLSCVCPPDVLTIISPESE
jgi:hypothetical protein